VETINGTKLEVSVDSGKTTISHASIVRPDIYASNGVIHFISELIIPPGSIELTPEKYLLALNCSTFVSLIHSVNLTSFINDTSAEYTILAPKDDVISVFGGDQLPKKGSKQLEKVLRYHIVPGNWTPGKLEDKTLLETALLEEGLDGGKQVLHADVTDGKHIRFGGASVLGDPSKFYGLVAINTN
jgi:solute carrier family 25 (mitochondrial carnitine/acylcarnitine transporter), member 20/29